MLGLAKHRGNMGGKFYGGRVVVQQFGAMGKS